MARNSQYLELIEDALLHMEAVQGGHHHGGMLLSGDPGIGKTTFVEVFASLLGIKAIVIEVPHVTEEHLINIPFVVFNGETNQETSGNTQLKPTQRYSLTLADSNLYTQLNSSASIADAQYIEHIKKAPAIVQTLYKQLGGTEAQIPPAIQEARKSHRVILFLDEFYRSTTNRIRNIMRGMLNGDIGMHKIPKHVYIMYASNMKDAGLDDTPTNAQFMEVDYKAASKDDWFDWLVGKYEQHAHIKVNHQVMDKFKKVLKDEDFGHVDVAAAVRTSPRRWENLILYINNSFPVDNTQDARALVTNVRNNFIHYETGKHSSIAAKVVDAVVELIKESSGIEIKNTDEYEDKDWRQTAKHMIDQQIKTGHPRKHVPVLSGPPGIGKTSHLARIAEAHNLRLVSIDIGQIFAEDVIGLPVPAERNGDKITVSFSMPNLYHRIMSEIEREDKKYLDHLVKEYGDGEAKQKIDEYKKQKFKYLIFLDELNRVDEKTFNSLRRVVLEKNFGADNDGKLLKLPSDALMMAAVNPDPDTGGTTPMTDHFRDVVDMIPAVGSWQYLKHYLMNREDMKKYPVEMKQVAMSIIEEFVGQFKDPTAKADRAPFTLDIGTGKVYVNPREYTDLFSTLIRHLSNTIRKALANPEIKENQIREMVDHDIAKALAMNLRFPLRKARQEPEEFLNTLNHWVTNLPDSIFGKLLSKKSKADSFSSTLEKYLDGHDLSTMVDDQHFYNANTNFDNERLMQDFQEALLAKVVDDQSAKHYLLDATHDGVELQGDDIKTGGADKVTLVENMLRAVVFTLSINEFTFERADAILKAMNNTMSKVDETLAKEKKISEQTAEDLRDYMPSMRIRLRKLAKSAMK